MDGSALSTLINSLRPKSKGESVTTGVMTHLPQHDHWLNHYLKWYPLLLLAMQAQTPTTHIVLHQFALNVETMHQKQNRPQPHSSHKNLIPIGSLIWKWENGPHGIRVDSTSVSQNPETLVFHPRYSKKPIPVNKDNKDFLGLSTMSHSTYSPHSMFKPKGTGRLGATATGFSLQLVFFQFHPLPL